jgi:hypothetical protein
MTMQADPAGLLGARVVAIDGEDVGVIGQVFQEDRTGMVAWVRVATEPPATDMPATDMPATDMPATVPATVPAAPDRFVPLAGVERTGEGVKVAFSRTQIIGGPQLDADGQLSAAQVAELVQHYGLTPA